MEVDLRELERTLSEAELIYLASGADDRISARPVSVMNNGLRVFIRTSGSSRKAREMTSNQNIAACVGHFYFTGTAKSLGSAYSEENAPVRAAYLQRYPGAFGQEDEYIRPDEQFFELVIDQISEWKYRDGIPVGFAEQRL